MPLVLGLSLAQGPINLDTFHLAGKTVQAVLPVGHPLTYAKNEEFEGWSYGLTGDGSIVDRHLGAGGWDELKRLYDARTAPVAEWRAKFVIFAYADILDHGLDGVLRERRSGFFGADRLAALQEIALFGSMVEAYSGGKLKFVPDVQFEEQAMRFDSPAQIPFGGDFAKRYFTPRVNVGGYEPDDKIYRGPYNSIFFLHDGLADTRCNTSVFGMPVTGLPFYSDYDSDNRGQLARRLFNAWYGHLVFAMSGHGYHVGSLSKPFDDPWTAAPMLLSLPQGLVSDSMWSVIANLKETNDFASHLPAKRAAANWVNDPWTSLPFVEGPAGGDVGNPMSAGGQGMIVIPQFAAYVAAKSGQKPVAFFGSDLGPSVVFVAPFGKPLSDSTVTRKEVLQPVDIKSGNPNLETSGYFSYKMADDPQQGKVAVSEEGWVSRTGWVKLVGCTGNGGPPAKAPKKYLDILVKNGFGSHTIEFVTDFQTVRYDLFGSNPEPAESKEAPAIKLALDPNGGWQHVVVDVSKLEELKGIYLTPGNARFWPVDLTTKPSISIASVQFVDSATPTPVEAASDLDIQAKLAASITEGSYSQNKKAILTMLNDANAEIVMNAANVYTHVKDKAAIDPLIDLSKHMDPRIAEIAMQALKFQGTDTARVALNTALEKGTFEANRFYAALTLADEKDPSIAESYSLLIDSKNRESRLAAVHGLAQMPGDSPKKFLLAMLLDTDPEVEATVAQLEDPKFEDFEKRMQWYAINDASDWMRAQANIAMLRSPLPGYANEAFKGISDDSYIVRIIVLQYLEEHPMEPARPATLGALADSNEEVRVQALKTLATMPSPANLNELAHVGMDTDPRVQLVLIDLAKKQKLKLSEPILDQLRKSADPNVVRGLNDL